MNVRTNLILPAELVTAIDELAGPRGRSRYVADVLARQIQRDRWYAAMKAASGAWREHPLFPDDQSVVEWVDAARRVTQEPWTEGADT